jgi:propionyl-CoA carboxylase alpha chain
MITRYAEPRSNAIRVDSGVSTGSKIGVYYDSMLAKIICCGKDRETVRTGLVEALNGYHIEGVVTNIDFVNSVLCHPEFAQGKLTTDFIERHFDGHRPLHPPDVQNLKLAALTAALIYHVRKIAVRESVRPMVSRIGAGKEMADLYRYFVRSENDEYEVLLERASQTGRLWTIHVDRDKFAVETPEFEFYRRRLKLNINGRIHRFRIRVERSFFWIAFCGLTRLFEVYSPKEWDLLKHMPRRDERLPADELLCPMPGMVVDVPVKQGERVYRGQNLVVLESMKMESGVASPVDGVIADVLVAVGQAVEAGDVLIRFLIQGDK